MVVLVEQRQAVVLGVAVGGVRALGARGQVVDPVQLRLALDGVEAAQQQVDVVGVARAQGLGQLAAHEGRDLVGRQVRGVAHAVELDVGLDVLGEVNRVASLAAVGHQGRLVKGARLVVAGLEDGGASHGRFGGGDDAEVLACDAEKNLPANMVLAGSVGDEWAATYMLIDVCWWVVV